MNLISYRGPGASGGLSSGLAQPWIESSKPNDSWWFVKDGGLVKAASARPEQSPVIDLPKELIERHYRYCNEFLWPIMHDLGKYAVYKAEDHAAYERFNLILAWHCSRDRLRAPGAGSYFVHDYQLGLLPRGLKEFGGLDSMVFWHIPWPAYVSPAYVKEIAKLAESLLQSRQIGFHTSEYAYNFMRLVEDHLPTYHVDRLSMTIKPGSSGGDGRRTTLVRGSHLTKLVVRPLGLDFEHWSRLSAAGRGSHWDPFLARMPFVLSVDRADYTKGIVQRIQAIEMFFERNQNLRGQMTFVQVCPRTRKGIAAFDRYWSQAQLSVKRLQDRWGCAHWRPMIWIETPLCQQELAMLYREASVMLVNSLRDGLNLTAKEFVACRDDMQGVLALSDRAGVWRELGDFAVRVDPEDGNRMEQALREALSMRPDQQISRMRGLQDAVKRNTARNWWMQFRADCDELAGLTLAEPDLQLSRFAPSLCPDPSALGS